jgi:hypothetical protein
MAAIIPFIGIAMSVLGQQQQGQQAAADAKFVAGQQRDAANASQAIGQRQAEEDVRQSKIVQSRAQAVAAASGADASDPTVVNTIGDIAKEGEYRALSSLYEGDSQARAYRMAAAQSIATGRAAQAAANINSVSTIFDGATSMYDRYGKPNRNPAATSGGSSFLPSPTSVVPSLNYGELPTGNWLGSGKGYG